MNNPTSLGDEVSERLLLHFGILIENNRVTLSRLVGSGDANIECYPLHNSPLGGVNQGSTNTAVGSALPLEAVEKVTGTGPMGFLSWLCSYVL